MSARSPHVTTPADDLRRLHAAARLAHGLDRPQQASRARQAAEIALGGLVFAALFYGVPVALWLLFGAGR